MSTGLLRLTILSSLFPLGLCKETGINIGQQPHITSKAELNAAIEAGPNRKVGFLSEANYNSVHTVLSSKIEPMIFGDTSDMYKAVEDGTVLAGFMSGQPHENFTKFSSEMVSARGFQMSQGPEARQLMEAVDAAVVRTHNHGSIQQAVQANPPFEALEVHTCRSDNVTKVPFPPAATATGLLKDVLDNKKLRILSYGSPDALPDWHQDGNYQVNPPTGFWPDYMRDFMELFRAQYGADIELERVWMLSGGTEKVLSGEIHMTEPYYIYENFHDGAVKKWSHTFSCIVLGYDQQFFAKKPEYSKVTDADVEEAADCETKLESCITGRLRNQITTRAELNAAIESGPNRKMGFLSQANYMSIHTMLSSKVEPMIYSSTNDLYEAVKDGSVVGALMSGQPTEEFNKFSTDMISPRSFQMTDDPMSRDLMEAVDAAVVRSHNAGDVFKAVQRNPPFQAIEVHTCKASDTSKVPFPSRENATGLLKDVLDNKKLKILAYGLPDAKPDWHQDGNYQLDNPTGFWPDYMDYFMEHFRAEYGEIELERVWMKAGGTDKVLSGEIHMTEPYYIYENMYNDRLKKWSHEFSCVVLGYEQQFFALKAQTDFKSAGNTCEQQLMKCENKLAEVSGAFRGSILFSALWLIGFATSICA